MIFLLGIILVNTESVNPDWKRSRGTLRLSDVLECCIQVLVNEEALSVQGNCMRLLPASHAYDRVIYCGFWSRALDSIERHGADKGFAEGCEVTIRMT